MDGTFGGIQPEQHKDGNRGLHIRSCFSDGCLQALMNHGANVDAVDDNGYTPLLLAVGRSHTAIALVPLKCLVHIL